MRLYRAVAIPSIVALAAACGRAEPPRIDEALSRDISLAAQSTPMMPQQFVSPQEMGYAQGYAPGYPQPYYQQPRYYPQPTPVVYRAPTPVRRAPARTASTGTIYAEPEIEEVKHTKRDAMIGATAGAVAGAAIGRDVKGALIGAAAGGLLGAVVGSTIDVERRPRQYP